MEELVEKNLKVEEQIKEYLKLVERKNDLLEKIFMETFKGLGLFSKY